MNTLSCWVISTALALAARAQVQQTASVLDGSGTLASGGPYSQISATAQPGGVAESGGDGFINRAGFLNQFILRPELDTDCDGLADELDGDNDNDQLPDWTELNGFAFKPCTPTLVNVADSDGDGVDDGAEAAAGTNPTDAEARFELVEINRMKSVCQLAWRARGNHEQLYVVRARTSLLGGGGPGTVIFSGTVSGGLAPWFVVTNAVFDATEDDTRFYTVEAASPISY